MQTDLLMVVGVIIFALTFPVAVSAFSHGKKPTGALFTVFVGGGLMVYANSMRPEGYSADEMPQLFIKVLSGLLS